MALFNTLMDVSPIETLRRIFRDYGWENISQEKFPPLLKESPA